MSNDEHPFDRAMRAKAQKEWEDVEKTRIPMTADDEAQILDALRNESKKKPEEKRYARKPFLFWFLGLGFAAFAILISLPPRGPESWSGWEDAGGSKATSTNSTPLSVLVEKEWNVKPNFKAGGISLSFGGDTLLQGELRSAPELNRLNQGKKRFYRLINLTNASPTLPSITGTGVLDLESTSFENSESLPRLKKIQRALLRLQLESNGLSQTNIRKIENVTQ